MSLKVKIFISDMGWGTLSRESAIINQLQKSFKNIKIFVQLKKNKNAYNFFFKNKKNIFLNESENLIKWFPNKKGSIDIIKTQRYYSNYSTMLKDWINHNEKDLNYDFFISDILPEVFLLGKENQIPTFGICHYTWDWYFSKIFPSPVPFKTIKHWEKMQKKCSLFFFPPLTPESIKRKYINHQEINFITRSKNHIQEQKKNKRTKILFMDSGENLNLPFFKKIISTYQFEKKYKFYHPESFGNFENTIVLKKGTFIGDRIKEFDLVIGRAGYNTMTEVFKFNIPAIFLRGRLDPEMDWNLGSMIGNELAGYIDPKNLYLNFKLIVDQTLFKRQKLNFNRKNDFNGQQQIVKKIQKII